MMKNWKRCLSIAMTLVMLVGVLPTAAFADGEPIALTEENVAVEAATYNGAAQEPVIKINGAAAEKDRDYTYTVDGGSELKNAGTYTLTITGQGNYSESVIKSFTINGMPVSELTITVALDVQTYDGSQKKPGVTVKHGETTLEEGTHYTLTYGTNIDAGENAGSVTITAVSGTNYSGDTVKNFTIQPMTVLPDAITVTIPAVTYGETPVPEVTHNRTTLASGTDYEVTYSGTDAGTQTATVKLKGNYSCTKEQTFTINAKTVTTPTIADITAQTYTGNAITPELTVKDGETTLTKDTDYTVVYSNNTNVGTATAAVTFTGNYSGGPFTKEFTIVAKSISDGSMSGLNAACNKNDRPVPTITVDGKTLVKDTDFTLVYVEGSDSLQITATGTGNYTGQLQTTIPVLAVSDTTAPLITGVEDGKTYYAEQTATITDTNLDRVEVHHNGSVSTSRPADTNPTTLSVNLAFSNTPYQIKAYDKVGNVTTITVTVTKKTVTSSMITIAGADNIVYDGTAKTPAITVKDGETEIADSQYTLGWENNTKAGTATVTVTMNDSSKYQGTASKTFTIKPKALTSTALSGIVDKTYTGSPIEQEGLTVKDDTTTLVMGSDKDYTVTYSNNTNPGTAKVTVVLRGNYTGTLEKTFTISNDLTTLASNIKRLAIDPDLDYGDKRQLRQLKAAYDALSAEEKATVRNIVNSENSSLMTTFENRASAAKFKLLNLPGLGYYRYTKGTSSNVVIKIDAEFGRTLVTEIRMGKNLTVIDPDNYEVKEGSVIVTLSSSYLKQIKDTGKYNLYIDLLDTTTGHTETVQTVVRVLPVTDIPGTGDPFQMTLWVGLLAVAVAGLVGFGAYEVVKKKKNAQKRLDAAMNLDEESSDETNTNE